MRRHFHKMHGLGNDFVIVDAREQPLEVTPERWPASIADRRTGVGCDQLILLEPSDDADLRMRIWNSDGGEVESCGNATRCVVALTGAKTIETDGGMVERRANGGEVEVAMGEPRFDWDEIPLAYRDGHQARCRWRGTSSQNPMAVNVGNPHLVFFVDDVERDAARRPRAADRERPGLPRADQRQCRRRSSDGGIKLRTWERGAGLTLACGTGACATAVAAIASKRAQSPVKVTMPGGALTIAWQPGEPIRMRGAATHVFEGEIDLEAFA